MPRCLSICYKASGYFLTVPLGDQLFQNVLDHSHVQIIENGRLLVEIISLTFVLQSLEREAAVATNCATKSAKIGLPHPHRPISYWRSKNHYT